MKTNALEVANYLIDIAKKNNEEIHLLKLVKEVYIAHGFSLALTGNSLLDPRFDKVEAWKYGPVIPCVYHSFKQYRNNPISEKTVTIKMDDYGNVRFEEPTLKDETARRIVEMVWKRYRSMSDSNLVSLTHKSGTPWDACYEEGANNVIPDSFTKLYYEKVVKNVMDNKCKKK